MSIFFLLLFYLIILVLYVLYKCIISYTALCTKMKIAKIVFGTSINHVDFDIGDHSLITMGYCLCMLKAPKNFLKASKGPNWPCPLHIEIEATIYSFIHQKKALPQFHLWEPRSVFHAQILSF